MTTAACTITATEGTLTGTSAVSVISGTAMYAYLAAANGLPPQPEINQYAIPTSSATPLTPLTPATVAASQPQQVVLHPNGLYAYSIDGGSNVHIYDIAPAGGTTPAPGTLTLRTGDPTVLAGTGLGADVAAVDPTGRYLLCSGFSGHRGIHRWP